MYCIFGGVDVECRHLFTIIQTYYENIDSIYVGCSRVLRMRGGVFAADAQQASSTELSAPPSAPVTVEESAVAPLAEVKNETPWPRGVFADVTVGTQGLGMDVGYSFNKYLKLRVRGTMLSYDHNDTWNDMEMKARFKSSSCGLILDVHPFGGSFRLSAGLNAAPLRVEADGNLDADIPQGRYYLGEYEVKTADVGSIRGRYKWDTVQPYFGFGWSCSSKSEHAWFFTADIGVNIIGKGKLSVGYSGDVQYRSMYGGDWKPMDSSTLEDIIRDEGDAFFEIADKIVVYPVIHLGVGCRF